MTMLPAASSSAWAPGGMTQVASYSSTISGPRGGVVEVRAAQHRRVDPAVLLAEIGLARRPARPVRVRLDVTRRRHAAASAQARADELDRHQLDRLVGAGAMAVGPLVLLAEGLLQMRDHVAHRSGRPAPAR